MLIGATPVDTSSIVLHFLLKYFLSRIDFAREDGAALNRGRSPCIEIKHFLFCGDGNQHYFMKTEC